MALFKLLKQLLKQLLKLVVSSLVGDQEISVQSFMDSTGYLGRKIGCKLIFLKIFMKWKYFCVNDFRD
ncbi:hypothetical protein Syn7502_00236 [Synechococcus sp. PCC 7502]|uniref:hypothetical protein n=1 Tax=Synechococcus sp. PCC 7502 TaxID=1173263 RepID=UPI00029FA6FE|nr:hypothetical protein [Synechococcus sp. PCC 7502]AFY72403.1 hypothetical protein Syn7502_00236 [Synechococcus sp. PCC 7502]